MCAHGRRYTVFQVKMISAIILSFCLFLWNLSNIWKRQIEGTVLKNTPEHAGANTLLSTVVLKNLPCIAQSWKDSTSGRTEGASQMKFLHVCQKNVNIQLWPWNEYSFLCFTPLFALQKLQLLSECLRSHFNTHLSDPTKWYNMSFSGLCSLEHNVSSLITKFIGNPDTTKAIKSWLIKNGFSIYFQGVRVNN